MSLLTKLNELRRRSFQLFVIIVTLGAAIFIATLLIFSKPEPAKTVREATATPVEVLSVAPSTETIVVTGFGTVTEERRLKLQAEVSGRIVELSPNMAIGGTLSEGDVLLKIDPRDYEAIVAQQAAALATAELALKLEKGKQVVAEREWELLDPSIHSDGEGIATDFGRELALRQPQAAEKAAALEAAKSNLAKAELDLERTILRTPFNAVVLSDDVEIGQVISAASTVATLVATDTFWVQVSIPIQELEWLRQARAEGEEFLQAEVIQSIGNNKVATRQGHVVRLLSDVDPDGRMARILVAVDDPLSLTEPMGQRYPLLLGSYVRVSIQGPEMGDVYRVPRAALRDTTRVWVLNHKNELEVRIVNIVYRYADYVVVDKGLHAGDKIVTSQIPIPVPGMPLREIDSDEPAETANRAQVGGIDG